MMSNNGNDHGSQYMGHTWGYKMGYQRGQSRSCMRHKWAGRACTQIADLSARKCSTDFTCIESIGVEQKDVRESRIKMKLRRDTTSRDTEEAYASCHVSIDSQIKILACHVSVGKE